jgi:hypothetical protein
MTFYEKHFKGFNGLNLQQDTDAVAFADDPFPAEAVLPGFRFWIQILILYTDPASEYRSESSAPFLFS